MLECLEYRKGDALPISHRNIRNARERIAVEVQERNLTVLKGDYRSLGYGSYTTLRAADLLVEYSAQTKDASAQHA